MQSILHKSRFQLPFGSCRELVVRKLQPSRNIITHFDAGRCSVSRKVHASSFCPKQPLYMGSSVVVGNIGCCRHHRSGVLVYRYEGVETWWDSGSSQATNKASNGQIPVPRLSGPQHTFRGSWDDGGAVRGVSHCLCWSVGNSITVLLIVVLFPGQTLLMLLREVGICRSQKSPQ